jgi:hypothetical protein
VRGRVQYVRLRRGNHQDREREATTPVKKKQSSFSLSRSTQTLLDRKQHHQMPWNSESNANVPDPFFLTRSSRRSPSLMETICHHVISAPADPTMSRTCLANLMLSESHTSQLESCALLHGPKARGVSTPSLTPIDRYANLFKLCKCDGPRCDFGSRSYGDPGSG